MIGSTLSKWFSKSTQSTHEQAIEEMASPQVIDRLPQKDWVGVDECSEQALDINFPAEHFQQTPPIRPEDQLLSTFNKLSIKLEEILNTVQDKKDYITKLQSHEVQVEFIDQFYRQLGIIGGAYVVADQPQSKINWIQNARLQPECRSLPFFRMPIVCPQSGEFEGVDKTQLNQLLIEMMFESDSTRNNLKPERDNKAPYWYQNLPPFQSRYALPPLPFEAKAREAGKIDYLYCYTGEVLFFLYAWLWAMRYAQLEGFDNRMELFRPGRQSSKGSAMKIWVKRFWNAMSNLPEKEWLEYIRKIENEGHENLSQDKVQVLRYWKNFVNDFDGLNTKSIYHFHEREWYRLGLVGDNPQAPVFLKALKSYCRHLLLNLEVSEPWVDKSEKDHEHSKPWIVNKAIDQILGTEVSEARTKLVTALFDEHEYHNNPDFLHYIFRRTIIQAMTLGMTSAERKNLTAMKLLNQIHRRTRFPILPAFFQLYLSEDKTPPEFLVFPLTRSFEYPIQLHLPEKDNDHLKLVETNCVGLSVVLLKPVWSLAETHDNQFHITPNKAFYTYEEQASFSPEASARLRFVRSIIRSASSFLADSEFYGKNIAFNIMSNSTEMHYFHLAHETRKIIRFIKPDTPSYVLNEIRFYFNILFGSNQKVFLELLQSSKELKKAGTSYKDLIMFVYLMAIKIENIIRIDDPIKYPKEDFDKFIETGLLDIQVIERNPIRFEIDRNDKESVIRLFYFACALISGFRNAFQHKQPVSIIKVIVEKEFVYIINSIKDTYSREVKEEDFHWGSTPLTLRYYVTRYGGSNEVFGSHPDEANSFLTKLPIPGKKA
jgi:hypothetical protein